MAKINYQNKVQLEEYDAKKFNSKDANDLKTAINENADILENKVEKIEGKGLSTNDYTNDAKDGMFTATTNANTATTNAINAKNDAITATGNLELAKNNAINATTNANTATANAITAKNEANTATANAITAKNDAITATNNANNAKGWTPVAVEIGDGDRIVKKVSDYIGGTGNKPTVNLNMYFKADGTFTAVLADATNYGGKTLLDKNTLTGVGEMRVWTGTEVEYNAITVKDNTIIYLVR